ncbi:hypothetical protein ACLOJK_012064 [Asimina triloba]
MAASLMQARSVVGVGCCRHEVGLARARQRGRQLADGIGLTASEYGSGRTASTQARRVWVDVVVVMGDMDRPIQEPAATVDEADNFSGNRRPDGCLKVNAWGCLAVDLLKTVVDRRRREQARRRWKRCCCLNLAATGDNVLRPHRICNELVVGNVFVDGGFVDEEEDDGCCCRGGGAVTVVGWDLPEMDKVIDDIILKGSDPSIGPHHEGAYRLGR